MLRETTVRETEIEPPMDVATSGERIQEDVGITHYREDELLIKRIQELETLNAKVAYALFFSFVIT